MSKKNIIFNHTLEQYNKKYRNRRHRLLKYTKKQVEDFDKEYGHYIFNNKTYNLEHDHYLLKDKKWWFTKEDECYHEIPKPIRFAWFRNLNTGIQIATCALLAGGVIAGTTVGIIEYKKYDATLVVMGKSSKLPKGIGFTIGTGKTIERQDSTSPTPIVCISYEIKITTTESYVPTIEGGKPELVDVSVKKGDKELEKFVDFTFNSATGEVVIKKESMDKYYGKTVITPTIKTIKHVDSQQTWMDAYKPYNDEFQGIGTNKEIKRYENGDIKVLGLFKNLDGKFVEAKLSSFPIIYNKSGEGESQQRNAYLYFNDPNISTNKYVKEIGGGKYSHSRIQTEVFTALENQGYKIDYIIGEDYVKFDAFIDNALDISTTIDSNGYLTNTFGLKRDGASQLIIEYKGAPSKQESYDYTYNLPSVIQQGQYYLTYYYFNYNSKTKTVDPLLLENGKIYNFNINTFGLTQGEHEFVYGLQRLSLSNQASGNCFTSATVTVDGQETPITSQDAKTKIDISPITDKNKNVTFTFKWTANTTSIVVAGRGALVQKK